MYTEGTHPFIREYHTNRLFEKSTWCRIPIQKFPCDLIQYQEIIFEQEPDYIIETGTLYGGSALFFADMMELLHGNNLRSTVTIDITRQMHPDIGKDNRIIQIIGDSSSNDTLHEVCWELALVDEYYTEPIFPGRDAFIVLDSVHSADHVYKELCLYSPLLMPGNYIVVEDGYMENVPQGVGPQSGIARFLNENPEFELDLERCHKYAATFAVNGYIRRR